MCHRPDRVRLGRYFVGRDPRPGLDGARLSLGAAMTTSRHRATPSGPASRPTTGTSTPLRPPGASGTGLASSTWCRA